MIAIEKIQEVLQGIRGAREKTPFSFVEVCCTNSTVLAFDDSQAFPRYVVRIGDEVALRRYWEKLSALGQLLPQMIPATVVLTQLSHNHWMLVQAGVPGTPWFSLSSKINSSEDSTKLVNSSLEVLRKFHAVVNLQPGWRKELVLADAFRQIVEQARVGGIVFSEPAEVEIATTIGLLGSMGKMECHWQHGDFCFNNLVFHRHNTSLLDFDDFGRSSFPLLDQAGLAYSISERIDGQEFWNVLQTAAGQSQFNVFENCQLRALVVCHLIDALVGTLGIDRRQARQVQLLNQLNCLGVGK